VAKQPEEQNLLDAIRDLKHRDPFTPFRVVMSSGESYTVEHPDLLAMNENHLVYCLPRSNRVIYMRVAQIVTVDDIGEQSRPRPRRAG
jgi:hypothetical protein